MRRANSILALAAVVWIGGVVSAQQGAAPAGQAAAPAQQAPTRGPHGVGRPVSANDMAWDISIHPDGRELPPGSGNATQGALVFTQRSCSTCHGPTGKEGPAPNLIGGEPAIATSYYPIVWWPFAPMIWDWINRAMPYDKPGRLTSNETYALTAFLLFRNGIIQEEDVMDATSLPKVLMPHRADYRVPPPWMPGTPRGFQNKVSTK